MKQRPPLILLRRILRVHRQLPPAMRALGDDYVKSEFRRHQTVTDPMQVHLFMKEWTHYADQLQADISRDGARASQPSDSHTQSNSIGKRLSKEQLDLFSNEQLGQLFVLKQEAKQLRGPQDSDNDTDALSRNK